MILPKFDFHIHTYYSDGIQSPLVMVESAAKRDLSAVAITDHGPDHVDGISPGKIDSMLRDVKNLKDDVDFPVLLGIEANIGPRGGLDISKSVLKRMDVVLAGIHSLDTFIQIPEVVARDYLSSVMEAIKNWDIDIVAHPFWFYGDVSPYIPLEDLKNFAKLTAEEGVAIELNERYRVPSWEILSSIMGEEVKISVGSDAHAPGEVGNMRWATKVLKRVDAKPENLVLGRF